MSPSILSTVVRVMQLKCISSCHHYIEISDFLQVILKPSPLPHSPHLFPSSSSSHHISHPDIFAVPQPMCPAHSFQSLCMYFPLCFEGFSPGVFKPHSSPLLYLDLCSMQKTLYLNSTLHAASLRPITVFPSFTLFFFTELAMIKKTYRKILQQCLSMHKWINKSIS